MEKTILSVLNQNYPNLEYIIIDGASTDGSVDVIKKYSQFISYWVSESDEGQSEAILKGFRVASGDVLCWLNSDDIYLPCTLKLVSDAFLKSNADVVYGNKLIIDKDGVVVSFRLLTSFLPEILRDAYLCGGFGIYQPAAFWRRELYDRSGGVDNSLRFCMDNDLFNKFILSSAEFYFLDEFLAGFRIHSSSKTSTLNVIAETERLALYKKYVIDRGLKYPKMKIFCARLYRFLWFFLKGRLHKVIYVRFIDRLKWVP